MAATRDDLVDHRTDRQRLVDALLVERFGPTRPTPNPDPRQDMPA